MSVRERAERIASEAAPDPIVRNPEYRHGGRTGHVEYVGSVRERLTRLEDAKQEAAAKPVPNAAIEFYYAEHLKSEARTKAQEAAEEKRNQERIEQRRRDAEAERQRLASLPAQRLKERLLAITYTDMGATPAERKHVDSLVRQNHPERFGDPDTHKVTLMKLRDALGR
jgi:flagellar motor protein MotB